MSHPESDLAAARRMSRRELLKKAGTVGFGLGLGSMLGACGKTAPGAGGKTQLRFWTWLDSGDTGNPRAQAQAQILKTFRKANPDIELVEEVVPWQELHKQILQATAGGQAPDVSRLLDNNLLELVEAGAIQSLDEFVNDWSTKRRNDYVYAWDDTVFEGQKFAFRQSVRAANLLYYRTDLFSAVGFDDAPRTYDEFTEATKEISATTDVIGYVIPFSKADLVTTFFQTITPLYWQLGSDLVDLSTGKATFHEEAGQQIFSWCQDMVYVYKASPVREASMDSEATSQLFIGGGSAANLDISDSWVEIKDAEELKGRLAYDWQPSFTNDPNEAPPINTSGAWTLVMPSSEQKEAAWRFMEFMQSPEAELIAARVGGELPTRRSTSEDPFFDETSEGKRMLELLKHMQENAHPATTLKIRKFPDLANAIGDAGQEIIANRADVAETLAAAAERYNSVATS
jgi:multiple sugar transport system substrate-binding protein